MNLKLLQGYLLAVVSVAILVAAVMLVVSNIGYQWQLHVFWRPFTQSRAIWLLLAGAGGVVVYLTLRRLVPRAVADLREGNHIRREKITSRHVQEMKKNAGK